MPEIHDLLDWAARQETAALPDDVLRTALTIVCDDLAAMIAAHAEPEVRAVSERAAGPGESTVVGISGKRAGRRAAALANAVAANWTELDGGYRPATCHGSLYTLPVALAETEAEGATLGDLLGALVVGYEVVTRIARAYRPPLPLVLHPHATLSPIGAAAAIASARRLPADRFAQTVLGAASMSLTGPFGHATEGATVRNAWAGAGAQLGFLAAEVADAGLTASPAVLDEVFGRVGGATARPHELTAGLGERYAVEDGYQKPYACCQYLHSSVEAAATIAREAEPASIAEIAVRAHPLAAALRNAAPETSLAGRFSLPHAVATVLSTRDTSAAAFAAPSLADPAVARLRSLVTIEEWQDPPPPPHDRPSRMRVTLEDGRVLEETVLSAAGGPDRPLSRDQLLAKYAALTGESRPGFAGRVRALTDPARALDLGRKLGTVLDELLAGTR
ncbi:MmgE/PrpD family protein [Amycolatopsis sp. K13G38]|uniref:MmgE/PrpD family protein n=1 Tax=Amycolatopsis acididurans TaxID=2724524 RepID=A0ABX1IWA1_9PSEU|nr:MmgE/PrpD family protein [Amycolatopsis acididurans]NKQ51768.1 MmgE/PrpD family protein [Amycolatopsis acididurans]